MDRFQGHESRVIDVALRVPPEVAKGFAVAVHPTRPQVAMTDWTGTVTLLDVSGFPPR